jgi:hypothetical protein
VGRNAGVLPQACSSPPPSPSTLYTRGSRPCPFARPRRGVTGGAGNPSTNRSNRSLDPFCTVAPVSQRRIDAMPNPEAAANCSCVIKRFRRAATICSGDRTPRAAQTAACCATAASHVLNWSPQDRHSPCGTFACATEGTRPRPMKGTATATLVQRSAEEPHTPHSRVAAARTRAFGRARKRLTRWGDVMDYHMICKQLA